MNILLNKQLILESLSDIEKHKLLMQNFINNFNSKDSALEMHNMAILGAGVVPGDTKSQLIEINQKNKSLGGHHTALDRENNGIDANDLKMQTYASKALL
jgi:hypothetical protein